ncbi:heavy-metal-associated domain-containing protein [Nocardia camponoti]|uniref:Copper chaperone n=1 Tax=Nocardia camponoti TaxID=1616106 RepID=A0A917Q899_9NOCA|nr:heavy-metal-associated domain-containing protein [Nocardia camponoti]GGK34876.1 hypothetical protein GCM10011591_03130 [Nocardia camponoti]
MYDRRAAAKLLASVAARGLFSPRKPVVPVSLSYRASALTPEPGSALTQSQRLYLAGFMRPCSPDQVTSATHRITWTDSAGIPNTGYYRVGGAGPELSLLVRETILALWDSLAVEGAISDVDRAVLEGTTTDHDLREIFRVGIEAAGRAIAQHGLIADDVGYGGPVEFARLLGDSGVLATVATSWFWELQASTYRRGMIPVRLRAQPDGGVRYTADSVAVLRAMKEATIADAHAVMARATTEEGLSVEAAIGKYHDDLDLISRQYALLPAGAHPACLAASTQVVDGGSVNVLSLVSARFLEVLGEVADAVRVVADSSPHPDVSADVDLAEDSVFFVPDMSCQHCVRTITAVLTAMDIPLVSIDLGEKRVVARFRSPRNRFRAFEALRDGGYNPVDAAPTSVA